MKILSLILSLLFFFSVGCEKENPYDFSGTYQLTSAKAITISKEKLPVTISASNISDSRCPPDVQCVWEGYASADVTFKSSEEEKTIKTCTGGCNIAKIPASDTLVLNGISYEVKLKDITVSALSNQKTVVITLIKR